MRLSSVVAGVTLGLLTLAPPAFAQDRTVGSKLSAEGRAAVERVYGEQGRASVQPQIDELQKAREKVSALASAEPLDSATLEKAMADLRETDSKFRALADQRFLDLLKSLSPADRKVVVRGAFAAPGSSPLQR